MRSMFMRVLTVGLVLAAGGTAFAQASGEEGARKKSVGADVGMLVPIGDYGDLNFGFGVFGRVEVPVLPHVVLTGRVGYLYFTGAPSGVSFSLIPALVGLRYDVKQTGQGVFLLGELGVTDARSSISGLGSNSSWNPSFGLGAGYALGKISVRGTLFVPDTGHAQDSLGALLSAGYDFAAF